VKLSGWSTNSPCFACRFAAKPPRARDTEPEYVPLSRALDDQPSAPRPGCEPGPSAFFYNHAPQPRFPDVRPAKRPRPAHAEAQSGVDGQRDESGRRSHSTPHNQPIFFLPASRRPRCVRGYRPGSRVVRTATPPPVSTLKTKTMARVPRPRSLLRTPTALGCGGGRRRHAGLSPNAAEDGRRKPLGAPLLVILKQGRRAGCTGSPSRFKQGGRRGAPRAWTFRPTGAADR